MSQEAGRVPTLGSSLIWKTGSLNGREPLLAFGGDMLGLGVAGCFQSALLLMTRAAVFLGDYKVIWTRLSVVPLKGKGISKGHLWTGTIQLWTSEAGRVRREHLCVPQVSRLLWLAGSHLLSRGCPEVGWPGRGEASGCSTGPNAL